MVLSLSLFTLVVLFHVHVHLTSASALHQDVNKAVDDHHPSTPADLDLDLPASSSSSEIERLLHLSAVVNTPNRPHHAVVQCWALSSPFITYPTVGKALGLGDTANATYVVLPPHSAEGWHRPPSPMFFVLLAGLAHVKTYPPTTTNVYTDSHTTVDLDLDLDVSVQEQQQQQRQQQQTPLYAQEPTESLYIVSGVNPLIIAADTDMRSPGHLTFYPSDTETVAMQIPFKHEKVPEHKVLYGGPCRR
ncbi:hypothetical protein LTR99_002873 [Exophiala xenobiotica]|uniref:Uncharacterized protein n=1 Tax=Vermiconidia calcicola TaxID=1690605 RepID=A0AAV9QDS6_9PEZI|nr:hypothetical protein LTR92_005614 [Exophiala xenobiotica]KAK5538543.1 hypothetical protein LTR25_004085 [Vermiconidia calcicola]KAK5547968.1 hypothetical protein LTR23_002217 [Chaetothyriales sp. CCFEE 6169]KAK5267941.1 hypothetical protein LTR96_006486 [Exophiala xenobiotica]KAK5305331.1 hypothetical protein LTR99_002873 [Exophiala xenobiotica]